METSQLILSLVLTPLTRCRVARTAIAKRLFFVLFSASAILQMGCQRVPPLVDYRDAGLGLNPESAPIIIVGQILNHADVDHLRPSRWYPDEPMQLCRVTVRVENVLRGNVNKAVAPIYYLISIRRGGHARMGMVGRGGHWRIDDRAIFFLRWDFGILRTVYDTWASATPPVLSGSHPGYKPRPNEPMSHQIIDILLDKGQDCDEAQWAYAIFASTTKAQFFDLAYTVRKLRQIAATEMPQARSAARTELDELSYSWPKIRDGWPGPDKNTNK